MAENHPAFASGNVAVITGAADGIGFAVASRLAAFGMHICLADRDAEQLGEAARSLDAALAVPVDVSDRNALEDLAVRVREQLGPVSFLMNNAGTGGGGDALSNYEGWCRVLSTNLFGVLHGVQAFAPAMAESGKPGIIVNTGSKQGITSPPGDTAYNVSKAGVKVLTEGLAHSLRNKEGCRVTAHLLVPGFTFTGMMRRHFPEKPPSAWEPVQVADRLLEGLAAGDFYILCEDNETTAEMDRKRVYWAAHDIIDNRPALSRWHEDWQAAYEEFMARPLGK